MLLLYRLPNTTKTMCRRCSVHFHGVRKHYCTRKFEWNAANVRQSFLDFFCHKHDHLYVPSSSVIPKKGQGTYFTNAGMNQFKPIFLGTVDPLNKMSKYTKVTNYQKCIRVGGKHNDLEDVGRDLYHHTFFEMLGSWSFGDYFKREACSMALELLTTVYRLPLSRLYFTYFKGSDQLGLLPDLETRDIWLSLGIPKERTLAFDIKDNFWDMGFTGPCGPCTEIHYDHTGEGTGAHLVNQDSPYVVEIWNLVFMQYNRCSSGSLESLPTKHVDTGMGLERLLAVLQRSISNYDTDLFQPIFKAISKEAKTCDYRGKVGVEDRDGVDMAYRVVADHLRMSCISIADGLIPGRTELPYQLRNVMLRCIHQAYDRLGLGVGSLSRLVDVVVENLGDAHPSLCEKYERVKEVTEATELWYENIMKNSKKSFDKYLRRRTSTEPQIPVEDLLLLNSSIPFEILEKLAEQEGLAVNSEEFYHHLQLNQETEDTDTADNIELTADMLKSLEQEQQPYTDDSFKYSYSSSDGNYDFGPGLSATVLHLVTDTFVEKATKGENCGILCNKSNFYSEAGGQAADVGIIKTQSGIFSVTDVKNYSGYVLHCGTVKTGNISVGDAVTLQIDEDNRLNCMRNHTATHLLNSGLQRVVSSDVVQSGSSVTKDRLIFEFTSMSKVDNDAIQKIDELVKETISRRMPVHTYTELYQDVENMGNIVYLRDHEYPARVTVVSIGTDHQENKCLKSAELCGGTHVHNTGDIGDFCVVSVTGTGQAKKEFKCFTGDAATRALENGKRLVETLTLVKTRMKEKGYSHEIFHLTTKIQQMMNTLDLPSSMRRKVEYELNSAPLRNELSTGEGKMIEEQIIQRVKEALNTEENFAICQCHIKSLRVVNKALLKIDCSEKPVFLVTENDHFNGIIISAHQNMVNEVQILMEKLQKTLNKKYPEMKWRTTQKKKSDRDFFCLNNLYGSKELDRRCYQQALHTLQEHFSGLKEEKKYI